MNVSGKHLILGMLVLGAAIIGGYDLVRRLATPETASLVEDRGEGTGTFDRIYRFGDERFRLRHAPAAEGAAGGSVVLARLDDSGEAAESIAHPAAGEVLAAHFLELVDGESPMVVAIVREGEVEGAAEPIVLRLGVEPPRAGRLAPLPPELARRKVGGDVYDRQGAFLYREITLAPAAADDPPVEVRLFYDFANERWVVTEPR